MFTVYTEKDAFENIVLYKENSPNWYNIFSNHAEVCINITEEDLSLELIPGAVIFEYVNSYGGRLPIALKYFFDEIYDDNSIVVSNPRSAFFLIILMRKPKKFNPHMVLLCKVQSHQ